MSRKPDPFEGAKCRSDEHRAWMKEHGASMWDYCVDREQPLDGKARRRRAVGLCFACPKTAKTACRELHDSIVDPYHDKAPGIWAGRVYSDREPHTGTGPAPLTLMTRDELAA